MTQTAPCPEHCPSETQLCSLTHEIRTWLYHKPLLLYPSHLRYTGTVGSGDSKGSDSSAVGHFEGGGTSALQVMSAANYDWFEDWDGTKWHKRGKGYEAFKQHMQHRLMPKLGG